MAEWVATEASGGLAERDASGMIGAHTVALDTVCNILGQAFEDDPVLRWCNDRPDFAPELFRMVLPGFMKKGLTYLDEHHQGAASWLGPHDQVKRPFTLANVMSMASLCGFRGMYRLAASGGQIGRYHPGEAHYYLFAIGTLPSCRGQGVGSSLMRHMLRRCDNEQMPAYLENSRRANLDFYRGHGFEVQRQIQLGRDGPPLWLMWREPHKLAR